jgi:peroxiredoxin
MNRTLAGRRSVRTAQGLAVAAALAVIAASPPPAAAGAPARDAEAILATRELGRLDGGRITLGGLRGEVVVVNFWASWCRPCRRELPALDALHAELVGRGGRVVAVSIDEDVENARRFARANRLSLPIVHDGPEGLARELDLDHVPCTFVLDRDGRVAYATSGSDARALRGIGDAARRLLAGADAARAAEGGR